MRVIATTTTTTTKTKASPLEFVFAAVIVIIFLLVFLLAHVVFNDNVVVVFVYRVSFVHSINVCSTCVYSFYLLLRGSQHNTCQRKMYKNTHKYTYPSIDCILSQENTYRHSSLYSYPLVNAFTSNRQMPIVLCLYM